MSERPQVTSPRRAHVAIINALLILATFAAYSNSFTGPFVFDDQTSILKNTSIRHLWLLSQVLSPPIGETVGGRPLVNLSFAINYALHGTAVWGYHLGNLLVHTLAGLVLFGVLRRTVARTAMRDWALAIAGSVTAIWLLHPLQTESVTYMVQRAEALVSLCYLLVLYTVIRSTESSRPWPWHLLAIVACAAGMASKEVMVSAPFMVLLYDRTFLAGSFRAAWRARRGLYLGLLATLLLLAALMLQDGRGATAGFDTTMSTWSYLLTQSRAIVQYLSLVVWPDPLIFDYGHAVDTELRVVVWRMTVIGLLLIATSIALWKRPVLGFAGAIFFAVLAPSSSIVPVATQTIAEHRMYLPLAAVVTLMVVGLYALLGRRVLALCLVWAAVLGWRTYVRNRDYRSEIVLWQDTADKMPGNSRAQHNLGRAMVDLGNFDEALVRYREAVRLDPDYAGGQDSLNRALILLNRLDAATTPEAYEAVLRSMPDSAGPHATLGRLLVLLKRPEDAARHFEMALAIDSVEAPVHNELGKTLARLGYLDEAIEQFEEAIEDDSTFSEAQSNLMIARRLKVQHDH